MTEQERFLAKVDKVAGAPCWLWTGATFVQGYGKFFPTRKKTVKAHRYSWALFNGRPVPEGLVVCHSCDNKLCVNPDHLRADTQAFNNQEAIERGRWKPNYGFANGRTILTPEQKDAIRNSNKTQMALAALYGISQTHVSRIVRGEGLFA